MKSSLIILALTLFGFSAVASDEYNFDYDTIAAGKVRCVLTDDCKKEHEGTGTCPSTARANAVDVCKLNSESKDSCIPENAVCN